MLGALIAAATTSTTSTSTSAFNFTVTPNASGAPGSAGIQSAIDVIAAYALYAAAAGFLLGAAVWAIGGRIGNDYTASGGKTGMVVALGVAFLVGAAPKLLAWAFTL